MGGRKDYEYDDCLLGVMAVACPSLLNLKGATAVEYVVVFNWTETWEHNVGEVASKEEYDNCSDPGIVLGPGVSTELKSTGSRFFICTVGNHCEQGQKVIITVGSPTTTSSLLAPPPSSSHASSLTTTTLGSFVGLISALVAVASFVA
ncbi:hypothetical protein DVH24_026870 [Malus domestica]|uniref:Phytocyanin domain-containing protein n=1 Tax=Malus domestica TaxID=3750 RepID=A0A498KQ32_MALDO|nr:hypothetical protein DVH24_026870 [Malus domestica]